MDVSVKNSTGGERSDNGDVVTVLSSDDDSDIVEVPSNNGLQVIDLDSESSGDIEVVKEKFIPRSEPEIKVISDGECTKVSDSNSRMRRNVPQPRDASEPVVVTFSDASDSEDIVIDEDVHEQDKQRMDEGEPLDLTVRAPTLKSPSPLAKDGSSADSRIDEESPSCQVTSDPSHEHGPEAPSPEEPDSSGGFMSMSQNPTDNPMPNNFEYVEEGGTVGRLICRLASNRAEDEASVATGQLNDVTLPTLPTPTYFDFATVNLSPGSTPEKRFRFYKPSSVSALSKGISAEETSCADTSSSLGLEKASTGDPESQPSCMESQQHSLWEPVQDKLSEAQSGRTESPSQPGQKESTSQFEQEMSSPQQISAENDEPPRFEFPNPVDIQEMSSEEERQQAARLCAQNLHKIYNYTLRMQAEKVEAEKRAKAEKKAAAAEAKKKAKEEEIQRLMISGPRLRRRSTRLMKRTGDEFFSSLNLIPAPVTMTQQLSKTSPNPVTTNSSSSDQVDSCTSATSEGTSAQAPLKNNSTQTVGPMQVMQPTRKKKHKSVVLESSNFSSPQATSVSSARDTISAVPAATSSKNNPTQAASHQRKKKEGCPLDNDAGWVKDDNWVVEAIVDSKFGAGDNGTEMLYKVKWQGWESEHNSWVSEKKFNGNSKITSYCKNILKTVNELNRPIRQVAVARDPEDPLYFTFYGEKGF